MVLSQDASSDRHWRRPEGTDHVYCGKTEWRRLVKGHRHEGVWFAGLAPVFHGVDAWQIGISNKEREMNLIHPRNQIRNRFASGPVRWRCG
uniref:Uncharacterized protein n=1 Tax=Arundo donax TaxID=35708 RepID=A0A0A9C8P8_ARUDO